MSTASTGSPWERGCSTSRASRASASPATYETATTRRVQTAGGVPTKKQFELFPKKPAKKMAYIAGLPKPHGCV